MSVVRAGPHGLVQRDHANVGEPRDAGRPVVVEDEPACVCDAVCGLQWRPVEQLDLVDDRPDLGSDHRGVGEGTVRVEPCRDGPVGARRARQGRRMVVVVGEQGAVASEHSDDRVEVGQDLCGPG
jgi:hypothetical protein